MARKVTGKNAREKTENGFSRGWDLFPGTSPEGREKVHPTKGDFFPPGGSSRAAGKSPGSEFVPSGGEGQFTATYKGQRFICHEWSPHIRADGEPTILFHWTGACLTCGREFTFKASARRLRYPTRRCPAHARKGGDHA